MAPTLASGWRSFWHTMTSYDRHASHDSPYRTGQHIALPQSRNSNLTSIATSAMDSRNDLSYTHDGIEDNAGFVNGTNRPMSPPKSPGAAPYKPGMRASLQRVSSDQSASSEIQMQNFSDGLPPAPPVEHSWKRIDRWAEDTYAELYDNLSVPCTQNDINELEHELDCTLPLDVRQSLQIHDGQERGGLPTGIIFGCMLLDCEEIVQEWQNWQKVGRQYLSPPSSKRNSVQYANGINGSLSGSPSAAGAPPLPPQKGAVASASSSSSVPRPPSSSSPSSGGAWRNELMARQICHPPNTIRHAYTHRGWIPLARDWGGNCIAVDLAPGPAGKWGQVIVYGRDYDCKFVVARSWAHFLAAVSDDFGAGDFRLDDGEPLEGRGNGGKVYVDEDTGDLRFRQFWERQPGLDVPYIEVLRWRCERKYGRRPQPRRPPPPPGGAANGSAMNGGRNGLKINSNVPPPPQRSYSGQHDSPYGSPTSATGTTTAEQAFASRDFAAGAGVEQRGRSPNRFSQGGGNTGSSTGGGGGGSKAPHVSSPLAQHQTSAPLDRVAEEPTTTTTAATSGTAQQKKRMSVRTSDLRQESKDGTGLVSLDGTKAPDDGADDASAKDGSAATSSVGAVTPSKLGPDGLLATPVSVAPPVEIGAEQSTTEVGDDVLSPATTTTTTTKKEGSGGGQVGAGAEVEVEGDDDEMKTVAI